MKNSSLNAEDFNRILLEQFGSNYWFVSDLFQKFLEDGSQVTGYWQDYFSRLTGQQPVASSGKAAEEISLNDSPADNSAAQRDESANLPASGTAKARTGSSAGAAAVPAQAAETSSDARIPENYLRIAGAQAKIIDNMNSSLSIPVATSQRTISVKLLDENRRIINQYRKKSGLAKVSFTHIIAFAIVKAVKDHPSLNNSYAVFDGKPYLVKKEKINLGIAVDIERKDKVRSLIVPNIKDAGRLNFEEFAQAYDDIIERSRTGRIEPSDFQETTITLTNPGTVGTVSSIPRLMTGQGLIIAIGVIEYPAEYQAVSPETITMLGIGKIMNLTSTYDHRIIQGAESGLFLKELSELLLGRSGFYEELFSDMHIPQHPVAWEEDISGSRPAESFPASALGSAASVEKQARILQLINYYRVRGHLIANLNPLGTQTFYHPELDPSTYGFTIWDYDRTYITGGLAGKETATLREILDVLHRTYCEKLGVEYMHIQNPEEKQWLQQMMEPKHNQPELTAEDKKRILWKLTTAEAFEHFLHNKYIGHKRFSLEGSETVIPVLDQILQLSGDCDVDELFMGMAHRGRLNILANIIGKPYEKIFSEFEGNIDPDSVQGTGDVKYHLGASGRVPLRSGKTITVSVASNPSHLEWVNPVVEGVVRAKQKRKGDENRSRIIPLLIHGDAAFAGQGVVSETLNLSQLKGYRTGGTIHIIINNQIGFTTNPDEARSSMYASDAAKMVQSPIIHVNGDDPEYSLWAAEIAFEYRQKFHKDVVIDLFGFRRHGHNEGDDPAYTQPLMYQKIKKHPGVKEIYKNKLLREKLITEDEFKEMERLVYECLENGFNDSKTDTTHFSAAIPLAVTEEEIRNTPPDSRTSVDYQSVKAIADSITKLPEGFDINPKLLNMLNKRRGLLESSDYMLDWAYAETLAFGSLLKEGIPVRLSGQDSARGTFSQRHLILTNTRTGEEILPLNNLSVNGVSIEALDSLLSEAAVVGFEFGYSVADPLTLVLWEAQFGDFANGAQVIIDNFLTTSMQKWEQPNNLVLLLPHGYEGQGPEHSSARIERFLTLCAQDNMSVCYPTTPAQYFHLLRRQAKLRPGKPMVVFTPKSLLRLAEARSPVSELTDDSYFKNVIAEDSAIDDRSNNDKTSRIVFHTGKVHYDLKKFASENNISDALLVRLEQLYPFPEKEISEILNSHNDAQLIWAQEEPENMGAGNYFFRKMNKCFPEIKIRYAGRAESASPAAGSLTVHNKEQQQIMEKALKE